MTNDLEAHLDSLLNEAVAEHRRRKDELSRASWGLNVGAIALSACTTVLLGLHIDGAYLDVSRNIALVLSAALTLIASVNMFWGLDKYWMRRKVIYNDLVVLKEEFDYVRAMRGPGMRKEMEEIFGSYLHILRKHTDYWEVRERHTSVAVLPLPTGRTEYSTS
ncbi:SLATT domain-containing protein [Nocardia sp. NPDC050697]|uniref:SLATT domain-containing protein n=1 Tax=Nocardia sp. NPDC050697 TaxID=3155158 RepID=UPI0033F410BC